LEPGFLPAAAGLARLDLADKDPLSARRRIERIARTDPRRSDALIALAELGPAIGANQVEIRQWLLDAQKLDPASPRVATMLAQLHLQEGNPKGALATLEPALKRFPQNAGLLDALGTAQFTNGDTRAALNTYVQLDRLRPNSPPVLNRLGQLQLANGNHAAAVVTLRKVLGLQPNHEDALRSLAQLHLAAGRLDEAQSIAKRLQPLSRSQAAGLMIEGDVLLAKGAPEKAVLLYEQAHAREPSHATIIRLHTAMDRSGQHDAADQRLVRWVAEHPKEWQVHLHLADVFVRRDNLARAREHYLTTLQLRPDHVGALNNAAWVLARLGDARARDFAERAVALAPEDPASLDTLGGILVQSGDTTRAIELLERAIARAPGEADPRVHLAKALIKLGEPLKARSELRLALATDPPASKRSEIEHLLRTIPN